MIKIRLKKSNQVLWDRVAAEVCIIIGLHVFSINKTYC